MFCAEVAACKVCRGALAFRKTGSDVSVLGNGKSKLKSAIMVNLGNPELAFQAAMVRRAGRARLRAT